MSGPMELPGYDIIRQIGSGGMASVYLAVQKSLHREVALKVLTPGLAVDESYCQRFLKEGRISAQLSHVNVMTVYDIGVHDNFYYMAMEYLEGGTVRQRMKDGLTEEQIVRIIADIARGLNYAHSKGFVHRDVKPGNMLFRDDGSCVLGDFGIAKAVDSNTGSTKLGTSIGTPHYMSPEQARGEKVDHRTDLYSLGVVFYELLTNSLPFDAPDPFSVALMQINSPLPDLPEHCALYEPMIKRLMEKGRDQRYDAGALLIEDLAQNTDFLITGPITSPSQELLTELSQAGDTSSDSAGQGPTASQLEDGRSESTPMLKVGLACAVVLLIAAAWVWWPTTDQQSQVNAAASLPTPAAERVDGGLLEQESNAKNSISESEPATEKPNLTSLLQTAADQQQAGVIISADSQGAIGRYQEVLRLEPDNREAINGLRSSTDGLLDTIETLRSIGDLETASELLQLSTARFNQDTRFMVLAARIRKDLDSENVIAPVAGPSVGVVEQESAVVVTEPARPVDPNAAQVQQLLLEGDQFYDAHKYGFPPGANATDRYLSVLELAPNNQRAISQLTSIADSWADAAQSLLENRKVERALGMVELGLRARPTHPRLLDLRSRIDTLSGD